MFLLRTSRILKHQLNAPCSPTTWTSFIPYIPYIPAASQVQPITYPPRFSYGTPRRYISLPPRHGPMPGSSKPRSVLRENIYTVPNLLTASRFLVCPLLGWSIMDGNFTFAAGLLAYAGITDWVDGFIARRYKMQTVLGTILDPAADKALVTTLTVTLAWKGLLPVPLAGIIIGRDVLLSLSAFYYRYISLPPPTTFRRYWDFSIPSAEVRPTAISKINTALQLLLMGITTLTPLLLIDITSPLLGLQWTVAGTTVWSGLSYIFSKDAVRIISRPGKNHRPN